MRKKVRRIRAGKLLAASALFGTALFTIAPLLFLITGTWMGDAEIAEYLSPVLNGSDGFAGFRLLPRYPTMKHVIELFLDSPEFFHMFWNTMKITSGIMAGQLIFGMPGAWGLSRYSFPGKKLIYQLYIILMMMPFQVMMLSEYLVLEQIGRNNTLSAVILPGAFSTFSVFLMYRFFCEIPEQIIEAARVDGAGEWQLFVQIGVPLGRAGIFSAMILLFLECFSMVEQPTAFLKEKSLWPLSLYLPEIGISQTGFALCASLVALLPALLLFLAGQDYLEQGIVAAALKE